MGTELGNVDYKDKEDMSKEQIRCMVSSIYDLQKVRISIGNRIVQSFYISMGIKPSEKKVITVEQSDSEKEKEDKKKKSTLLLLRKEYQRVTDYVTENNKTIKSAIKQMNSSKEEEKALVWIRNESDYRLIDSYTRILVAEEEAIKALEPYVFNHPLWNSFFKDIKGCGSLMAAVCIAYFDPYKARHVSSFYKYAGIDAVKDTDEWGNVLYWVEDRSRKVREKIMYVTPMGDSYLRSEVKSTGEYDAEGNELFVADETGETCIKECLEVYQNGEYQKVYEDVNTGEEYIGEVTVSEHGRRKGDTEMYEYTAKDGSVKLKRGITYNPVVKEKLLGVLADCLIRSGGSKYATMYYDYKSRLDKASHHKGKKKIHKHLMAKRFMIKNFLRDLWVAWRVLEDLPVDEPYEVAKLGNKPHALNEYQCEVARKSLGLTAMMSSEE